MGDNNRKTKLRGTEKSSSSSSQFQANFNKEHEIEPTVSVLLQPPNSQNDKNVSTSKKRYSAKKAK